MPAARSSFFRADFPSQFIAYYVKIKAESAHEE